jgi:hypothetical protein
MGGGHPRVTNSYPPGKVRGPITVAARDDQIPVTVFIEIDDGTAGDRPGMALRWNDVGQCTVPRLRAAVHHPVRPDW